MGAVEMVVDHRVGRDAKRVVHGGVEILGGNGALDGVRGLLVAFAVNLPALNTAAGELALFEPQPNARGNHQPMRYDTGEGTDPDLEKAVPWKPSLSA